MVNKSRGTSGGIGLRTQANSPGNHEGDDLGTGDILAAWIAEDVLAFAKSLGLQPTSAFKEAVKRIESDSLLEQGDSEGEDSEELPHGGTGR